MTRTKVFVSYAHADDRWRKKLVLQLGVLAREDIIEIWDDQQLMAGQAWRSELQSQMSQARIAVLLVSASFLTSEFIRNKEVPKIFQQHEQDGLKIYPLLIGACAWQEVSWLSHLQLRPPGAQPIAQLSAARADGVLADVAREVAAIAREASRTSSKSGMEATAIDVVGVWKATWFSAVNRRRHDAILLIPPNPGDNLWTASMTITYSRKAEQTAVHEVLSATLQGRSLSLKGVSYTWLQQGSAKKYVLDRFDLMVLDDEQIMHGKAVLTAGICDIVFRKSSDPGRQAISTDGRRQRSPQHNDSPLRRGGATFKKNEFYTRKEINAHLGGSVQSYLPHVSGRVVAACLRVDTNPDAPDVILAGTGEGIERAAAMLIAQNTPVPTFIKRGVGNWEYIGEYTAERSSQDAAELHKWSRRSGRKDITRVIFMLPARPN